MQRLDQLAAVEHTFAQPSQWCACMTSVIFYLSIYFVDVIFSFWLGSRRYAHLLIGLKLWTISSWLFARHSVRSPVISNRFPLAFSSNPAAFTPTLMASFRRTSSLPPPFTFSSFRIFSHQRIK